MPASKIQSRRRTLENSSNAAHFDAIEGLSDYLTLMNLLFRSISQVLIDECGLTTLQYRMLLRLLAAEEGSMRTTDLAKALYVGVSTISAAVPRLVDRKLVRRAESHDDMRVVSISLEPRGRKEIEHTDLCVGSFLRGYWRNLTSEQLEAGLASSADAAKLHGTERFENGDFRYDTAFFDAIMISRTLTATHLAKHDLKTQELRVLLAMRILGANTTASQVATYLFLKSSDVTAPIKSLEVKGFIKKERNSENRRAKMLSLTDEGREKLEHMLPLTQDALRETCHSNQEAVEIHLSAARNIVQRERGATLFL